MAYGASYQRRLYYLAPAPLKDLAATFYGWKEKKHRHGPHYQKYFDETEETQWWSAKKSLSLQLERTRVLLEHAGKNSTYYSRLFQEGGFRPERFSDLKQLAELPVLTKPDFRSNQEQIISRAINPADVHWVSTSGTTGLGLKFPETWECFQREYAVRFHNYHCAGLELGDRWAICAGHPVADPERKRPPFWVRDRANNWLLMSSCHLTEANLRFYVEELERYRPDMIGGYPSSVYMLALANAALGRKVQARAVFTSSETLLDFQREAIEVSFGCKAYTYYGNGERCAFVAECEKGGLHVRANHSVVEFLDASGQPAAPGQSARMICTGFGNLATPLIRYDIGDTATVAPSQDCPCGRGGLLLERLEGRVEDYIVTPDGRFVGRLDHLFKDAQKVRWAQIVQEEIDRITLRIVREPGYSSVDEGVILKEARLRLGQAVRIEFQYVEDIERTATGKFRFVLSRLKGQRLYGRTVPATEEQPVGKS